MGGSKPKKVEASKYSSPYKGIQDYSVSLDGIGEALSKRSGKKLESTSTLAPQLKQTQNIAQSGLNTGLAFLARDPQTRMTDIAEGRNDFYNLANEMAKREYQTTVAQANKSFSSRGLEDSTTSGAFLGQLANDQLLRDLQTRIAALDYLDQKANVDVATNNATLAQLANFQALPLQMANQNLQTGYESVAQAAQFNAQQQQQAAMMNAQLAQQAAAQKQAMWGSLIGAGLTAAAMPFMGAFGGLGGLGKTVSAGAGKAIGSMVPSVIGRAF